MSKNNLFVNASNMHQGGGKNSTKCISVGVAGSQLELYCFYRQKI